MIRPFEKTPFFDEMVCDKCGANVLLILCDYHRELEIMENGWIGSCSADGLHLCPDCQEIEVNK